MGWVPTAILVFFGGWATLGNWALIADWYLHRRQHSLVPLIPGALGAVGLALAPIHSVARLWWLPLFFDMGSIPLLTSAIAHGAWRAMTGAKI